MPKQWKSFYEKQPLKTFLKINNPHSKTVEDYFKIYFK
ncbi:hypothetical protein JCM19300_1503 [Algibacter lectus]|uniref:Uncharacterized protein n=1 Tax=Algibacter lectus TaxID=221126 RepID=A0A090X4J6_9FLAO|nr:hypothetical protein JCM19300_1503 [Algibacter lectus]GAL77897.1 hypothetical protein JCM19274_5610 [Algibacter lectus]